MRRLTKIALVLLLWSSFSSLSDACVPLDIYIQESPVFAPKGYWTDMVVCVDSGGPVESWSWEWPWQVSGHYNSNGSISVASLKSDIPGGYYPIYVWGTNGDNMSDTEQGTLWVFEMDLDLQGVDDQIEAGTGGFIGVGETMELYLAYAPSDLYAGYKELQADGSDRIIVWEGTNPVISGTDDNELWPLGAGGNPSTLGVEGALPGQATLYLCYTLNGYSYPGSPNNWDTVKLTVVEVNLDIQYQLDELEENPGGFVELGGILPLMLRKVLPTSITGMVYLDATEGGEKICLWDNPNRSGDPITLPTWFETPAELEKPLFVEGIEVSSSPRDITLKAVFSTISKPFEDEINLTVYAVDTLTWETHPGNTTIETCPTNGGKRIFPGKKTHDDSSPADRMKVKAKATITPALADMVVYFKSFDVDDPSASDSPLDTTDYPVPWGLDNRGGPGVLQSEFTHTDADGVATRTFTVTMYPGDNFRMGASCSDSVIEELSQGIAENPGICPDTARISEMLTVWRKLWIERDSMAAVPTSGAQMNHVEGTADSYTLVHTDPDRTVVDLGQNLPDAFDDENQFKYGTFVAGAYSYTTRSSTAHLFADDEVLIYPADPNGDGAPKEFELYDDDTVTLPQYLPTLGDWASVFHDAYVEPDYLPSTFSDDDVPFVRNLSTSYIHTGAGTWNDQYDITSSLSFWTVLAVSAFQPETGKDFDPDTGTIVFGQTKGTGDDNQCVVHRETVFDYWAGSPGSLEKIMAHEIGHGAGIEDNDCEEGCLMWRDQYNRTGDHFCDDCLYQIRKDDDY